MNRAKQVKTMKVIEINCSMHYKIYFSRIESFTESCRKLNSRILIISDSNIETIYKDYLLTFFKKFGVSADYISFPFGEENKTRETKQKLEDKICELSYGRDSCFIAFGGGVVSDLVGFLASTYCRGVPVIYLPTSLLAMVDASIGGKTAVNTPYGKNKIGTFCHPQAVYIDSIFLKTLAIEEWRNGMIEVLKHAIILDELFFYEIENSVESFLRKDIPYIENLIYKSCLIKKKIIEEDEYEKGVREILNFGHTLAHVIEVLENYQIKHGEAVAIGILIALDLSHRCGVLKDDCSSRIEVLLRRFGCPLKTNIFSNIDLCFSVLFSDKKVRDGKVRFILLEKIGRVYSENGLYGMSVSDEIIRESLAWAHRKFA